MEVEAVEVEVEDVEAVEEEEEVKVEEVEEVEAAAEEGVGTACESYHYACYYRSCYCGGPARACTCRTPPCCRSEPARSDGGGSPGRSPLAAEHRSTHTAREGP